MESTGTLKSGGGGSLATWFVALLFLAFVLSMERCSDDDRCDALRQSFGEASAEYQQCLRSDGGGFVRGPGGSFGGFGTGGGHK